MAGQATCGTQRVASHALYYCVSGAGSPTIVLAAGAGLTSRTWDALAPALSGLGTVVTFDRAGLGRSEDGPPPRTPTQIARELAALLEGVGVEGPLVLVGHSMGGRHALRYATLYPHRVAGVVLLDTPPEGFEAARMELLTEDERVERRRILDRGSGNAVTAVQLERTGAQADEGIGFASFPRHVPLVVIPADGQDFGSLGNAVEHRRLWVDMSRAWLRLTDAGRFVVAEGSGHMIHHDRPQLVVAVVRDVIARLR